jgi:transposase-like protein
MYTCKHCGSEKVVKDGSVKSKQRYLCRECGRTSREGDKRKKYSVEQQIRAVKLYTEGVGLRSIERLEGIPAPLLVQWIRNFAKTIKEKLSSTKIPEDAKEIEILEMDELFTYYKKNLKKPMCGLLWTETGIKLLVSP